MKILCFFLLMAGFVVCKAQTPGVVIGRIDAPQSVYFDKFMVVDSVRVMRPDRMVCRVPDVAKVEVMPVKRLYNGDRMAVRMGESWKKRR